MITFEMILYEYSQQKILKDRDTVQIKMGKNPKDKKIDQWSLIKVAHL